MSEAKTKLAAALTRVEELEYANQRLRERIGYYERGNVPRLLGLADDQLERVREVLDGANALYAVTDGFDPRWIRAVDADGAQETLRGFAADVQRWLGAGSPLRRRDERTSATNGAAHG